MQLQRSLQANERKRFSITHLTFVAENCDEVTFDADLLEVMTIGVCDAYGDDYNELVHMHGTLYKDSDHTHQELCAFEPMTSAFRWLTKHTHDLTQIVSEDIDSGDYFTYLIPEDMVLSYTVVNGDFGFSLD